MITGYKETEKISLRMRGQVLSEMEHAYLNTWLGLPSLEIFQLQAAAAIMEAAKCTDKEVRLLTTVLLLIHHGLDTHEQIEGVQVPGSKSRQLQVLAGDYYSSKYFYLLARSGKVELVGQFAEAIIKINEAKVERACLLKRFNSVNVSSYIKLGERIHGELLQVLLSGFLPEKDLVKDLTKSLVQTYSLALEYDQFRKGQLKGNLSQVYLQAKATPDEIRFMQGTDSEIPDAKLLPLHVKYGTSSFLYEKVQAGLATCESLLVIQESELVRESFGLVYELILQTFQDTIQRVEER